LGGRDWLFGHLGSNGRVRNSAHDLAPVSEERGERAERLAAVNARSGQNEPFTA